MKNATLEHRQKLAQVFDALGHHRRIAILQEMQLSGKDGMSFGDLAERTGMPASALKHHVRMMKRGGLLRTRIKGSFTFVSLNIEKLNSSFSFLK